jgi:opacity protein-like surface antigen
MLKRILPAVAAAGLLASGAALAQTTTSPAERPWDRGFWGYAGISAGQAKFRDQCSRTITQFECDDQDTAWKAYFGGQFNRIVGMEFGYTDFGRINAGTGNVEAYAIPVTVTLGSPIGERFRVFGKVGGLYSRTDVRVSILDADDRSGSDNGFGWTYGAGLTFAVAPNIDLRADWDRHRMDFVRGERDVDMLSAGVNFRF